MGANFYQPKTYQCLCDTKKKNLDTLLHHENFLCRAYLGLPHQDNISDYQSTSTTLTATPKAISTMLGAVRFVVIFVTKKLHWGKIDCKQISGR
jgi:hypothetical protein